MYRAMYTKQNVLQNGSGGWDSGVGGSTRLFLATATVALDRLEAVGQSQERLIDVAALPQLLAAGVRGGGALGTVNRKTTKSSGSLMSSGRSE